MPLEVTIEKLVYGGDGLARTPEGIVLVPGALPGEQVTIELEPAKRGVRRAQLLSIQSPSPHRAVPPCPYFVDCGGCQHQQIAYEQQLQWKRDILQECFERIGKLKLELPIETSAAEPWAYRNRIRLHARKTGARFEMGFEKPASNEICGITSCGISSPALQKAIGALSDGKLFASGPDGEFEIELFATDQDRELMATITSELPVIRHIGDAWREALPEFVAISWLERPKSPRSGERNPWPVSWGPGGVTVRVGEFHYRVSHGSFFQTNRFLLTEMIEQTLDDLRGERALDLYAGVGFFSLPLARRFTHVVAVESHPAAAGDLQTNMGVAINQVYPYATTAEGFVSSRPSRQPWDLIVVDPPRHGLATPVRAALTELKPKQIVYVSCDPTTLARDVAGLVGAGYKMTSVRLMDLFPQTYHMETIVHLSR